MANRIQFRRDSAQRWASINPVLMEGEIGFETDTNHFKLGNGTDAWNSLEYGLGIENITSELGSSENLAISQKGCLDANEMFFFMQNIPLSCSSVKTAWLLSSDLKIAAASNGLQKVCVFNVEDYSTIYLKTKANNYYAKFYAFAFSALSPKELAVGTNLLEESISELIPTSTDFEFNGFLVKPNGAKTLLVQLTISKTVEDISVIALLKDEVCKTAPVLNDITNDLCYREKTYWYRSGFVYNGDKYAYSVVSYTIKCSTLEVQIPEGYAVKIRGNGGQNPNEDVQPNESGRYKLSSGNNRADICIYLTDTTQTLTREKLIADGVKIYADSNISAKDDMDARIIPYTWMGYNSYDIRQGVITQLSGKNFQRIFGAKIKGGTQYRIRFSGYGNSYGSWASYAFFDKDYKTNLTALAYDNNDAAECMQLDTIIQAPLTAEYLFFCAKTKSGNDMKLDGATVVIEEFISKQKIIDEASRQDIPIAAYEAGSSEMQSKDKSVGIIVAGQSNAAGRCAKADIPEGIVDNNGQIPYCHLSGILSKSGSSSDMTAFNGIYTLQDVWAFDAVIYKHLSDNLQKDFYVAKYAVGATAIIDDGNTRGCWQPNLAKITTSGSVSLLAKLRETISSIQEATQNGVEFKAVLWHQGEADGTSVFGAFEYYNNFKALIWYIRGIVKNPNLPFIFGTISHNSAQFSAIVEDAQRRIAEEDANVYMIDMSEAELLDIYHFNAKWSYYLGEQIWNILSSII